MKKYHITIENKIFGEFVVEAASKAEARRIAEEQTADGVASIISEWTGDYWEVAAVELVEDEKMVGGEFGKPKGEKSFRGVKQCGKCSRAATRITAEGIHRCGQCA